MSIEELKLVFVFEYWRLMICLAVAQNDNLPVSML